MIRNFCRRRPAALFLAIVLGLLTIPAAFGAPYRIFTLDNGLNVLIKEMPSAPVVALNIWVHAGSRNERPGEEGFSHLLEHMMFKGTASFPVGLMDREIKKLGAAQNAFTSEDYTCYHVLGSKDHLARLMELSCDAVLHSTLDETEFKKERDVVLNELRMDKDSPQDRSYNLLMETAYKVHPYRHPIVGYAETLASCTRNDLFDYYRRHYVPANMWVVVVGDVTTDQALDLVKKHMGSAPKVDLPKQAIPAEPVQTSKREQIAYGDIQQAYLRLAWHAPGIENPDNFVLDVISTLMGRGRSSRLYRMLVEEERLATNVEGSYTTSGDPSLFVINAELPQGNVRKFTDRAVRIISDLREDTLKGSDRESALKAELEKVKQQIVASTIFDRETAGAQALAYGHYATLGRLEDCEAYIDRIKSVTLEEIQRVAKNIFSDGNLSVVSYEPTIVTASSTPEMITLSNGLKLILKENHSSPLVAVAFQIDGGGLREGRKEAGLANLTAEMLLKGTEKRKAEQIAQDIEAMGTTLYTGAQKSFSTMKMVCLTEKFLPSLDLALDLLMNSDFPEGEFKKEQDKALEEIKSQQDDLFTFTYYNTLSHLFPDHPLGYSSLGEADQVTGLKRNDLVQFHKKHYIGQGMVVAIVGDFFISELKGKLTTLFSTIPQGTVPDLKEPKLPPLTEEKVVQMQKNREQAQIILATRTFARSDPRGPAMDLLKNILSGSMSSRLFVNLRDKESLAYEVWASNIGTRNLGYFFATLSTGVKTFDTAKTRLIEELKSIREKGFTDEELADAKSYILGQFALGLVDNVSQADTFSSDEFFGLGYDYYLKYPEKIKGVQKDEVTKVADEFMVNKNGYILGLTRP